MSTLYLQSNLIAELDEAYQNKNYTASIDLANSILKEIPNDAEILLIKGISLLENNREIPFFSLTADRQGTSVGAASQVRKTSSPDERNLDLKLHINYIFYY